MGFPWARILVWLAIPFLGNLPDPGIKPEFLRLLHWQEGSSPLSHQGNPSPAYIVPTRKKVLVLCSGMSESLWPHGLYSPPGYSVHGISQARILEWVVISFSRESSQSRDRIHVSCISRVGRWILYHRATWEVPEYRYPPIRKLWFCHQKVLGEHEQHINMCTFLSQNSGPL